MTDTEQTQKAVPDLVLQNIDSADKKKPVRAAEDLDEYESSERADVVASLRESKIPLADKKLQPL